MLSELDDLKRRRIEAEIRALNAAADKDEIESAVHVATAGETGQFWFFSPVFDESVGYMMGRIQNWANRNPGKPITIVFNSPGGFVHDGFAFYDFLRGLAARGHHITTKCLGTAMSMGAVLMQAGDERIMCPTAYLVIHEVKAHVGDRTTSEVEDVMEYTRELQEACLSKLTQRSTVTAEEIRKTWRKYDWVLNAKKSVEMGFADKVEDY